MPPPAKKKRQGKRVTLNVPPSVQKAIVKRLRKPDVRNIILKHGLNRNSENKITRRLESPLDLSQLSKTIIAEQELNHKIKLSDQRFKTVERSVKLSLLVIIPVMIALYVNKIKKDLGMYVDKKVTNTSAYMGNRVNKVAKHVGTFVQNSSVRSDAKKILGGIKDIVENARLPNMLSKAKNPPKRGWRNWAFGKPKPTANPANRPATIARSNSNEFFNANERNFGNR